MQIKCMYLKCLLNSLKENYEFRNFILTAVNKLANNLVKRMD